MRPDPSLYRIQTGQGSGWPLQGIDTSPPARYVVLLVGVPDSYPPVLHYPVLALLDTRLTNPSVRVNGVGTAAPVETAEWTRRHFSRDCAIVGAYRLEQRQVFGCADGNVQHAKAVPPEAGDAWAWMPLMALIDNEKGTATSVTHRPPPNTATRKP